MADNLFDIYTIEHEDHNLLDDWLLAQEEKEWFVKADALVNHAKQEAK